MGQGARFGWVLMCALGASAGASFSGCSTQPQPRIDDVLLQAQKQRKPVVLEIYTTWCGPCKRFAKETLPDKGVQAALSDVVFQRYDAERGPGELVASRYHVDSYPSFLVIDETGALCRRGSGEAGSVTGFLALLNKAREATRSKEAVQAELAAHKDDPATLLRAARWHMTHRYFDEAFSFYDRAASVAAGDAKTVAEARWEGDKRRRFFDLRKRTVNEARELISRFPGTPSARHALYIAALSGELARDEVTRLIAEHVRALPEPGPEPKDKNRDADPALLIEDAAIVALAARAYAEALVAAQRLVAARPQWAHAYVLLADAQAGRGDKAATLAALERAEAASSTRGARKRMRGLREHFERDGTFNSRYVEYAQYRVIRYFTGLEGGSNGVDGVMAISPLLSVDASREVR